MVDDPITDEWIMIVASRYHFRDAQIFEDGSFGSFRITHNQFKREIKEAYERGICGDISVPAIGSVKPWQKRQEACK